MTYTATAAAQLAGVTVDTVRTWARMGAVRATKVARRWVIDAASLARRISMGVRHTTKKETNIDTPWPSDHPDAALLDQARTAGVTNKALFDTIGERAVTSGTRPFSRADERKVRHLITTAIERTARLDEIAHLATCLGHDGQAKRTAAEKLPDDKLRKIIRDTRAYARAQKVDVRTAEEKAAARARRSGQGPATDRQVAYLADLLEERHRSGREGGFANVAPYYTDHGVDVAKLRTLTSAAASAMINSLTKEA